MTDETPASQPRSFEPAIVEAAIAHADRAVTRDAMRLHNPHDLNNIRQQIHAAALIYRTPDKDGEKMFHKLMAIAVQAKEPNPLINKAYAIIASDLGITLTPEEQAATKDSSLSLRSTKASAAQQPADNQTDMRALKQKVTPHHAHLDDETFVMPTKHNEEDYYQRLLADGHPEANAYRMAAQFSLTLSRIGQSLARYNPNYDNPVEFLDHVVDRVLIYNFRKQPKNSSVMLDNYVRGWRDEVKRDFMGVDPSKIEKVKATMDAVAEEVRSPSQHARHSGPKGLPTVSRHFRNLAEGYEYQRPITMQSRERVYTILTSLRDQVSERHDPQRLGEYFQAFMLGDAYKQLRREDITACRVLDLAIGEVCERLKVAPPEELKTKNYLQRKFRADQERDPKAEAYWQQAVTDAAQAAEKSNGIT